jgi:hypothetical protein
LASGVAGEAAFRHLRRAAAHRFVDAVETRGAAPTVPLRTLDRVLPLPNRCALAIGLLGGHLVPDLRTVRFSSSGLAPLNETSLAFRLEGANIRTWFRLLILASWTADASTAR